MSLSRRFKLDLVLPRQPERTRDLALARRLVGRGDEVEDLLARWAGRMAFASASIAAETAVANVRTRTVAGRSRVVRERLRGRDDAPT